MVAFLGDTLYIAGAGHSLHRFVHDIRILVVDDRQFWCMKITTDAKFLLI